MDNGLSAFDAHAVISRGVPPQLVYSVGSTATGADCPAILISTSS